MSVVTDFKIPEINYDLFARLIPGFSFIFALRFFLYNRFIIGTFIEVVSMLCAGYIIGFITNPISSRICYYFESVAQKAVEKQKEKHTKEIMKISRTNNPLLFDKMHAETTCFIQLSLFSFTLMIWLLLIDKYKIAFIAAVCIAVTVYFVLSAYDVALRRQIRIYKFEP